MQKLPLLIGTYTEADYGGKPGGIWQCNLNLHDGSFSSPTLSIDCENPSYLCYNSANQHLYAVNELEPVGRLSAYQVSRQNDCIQLSLTDTVSSGAGSPCHLAAAPGGSHMLAANYTGGSAGFFPVAMQGNFLPDVHFIHHSGSGKDPERQNASHIHSMIFTLDGRQVFVSDLGTDQLRRYHVNYAQNCLTPAEPPYYAANPGDGPRLCVFHPLLNVCYLINELSSTIHVLALDENNAPTRLQIIDTIPPEYKPGNTGAHVALSPDGRFLYASNRGHNSIAVFSINQKSGELSLVDISPCGGATPRHFALSPCGQFLIAANQTSHTLVSFRVNPDSGLLAQTDSVDLYAPVCVCPMPSN